jgi:uncharacterized membrane protein YvbJ
MISVGFLIIGGLKKEMPTCPHCGATVPEGAVYCGNCGATLNSPKTSSSTAQLQTSQSTTGWPNTPEIASSTMQARYDKAMKRAEQLAYATVGLAIAILVIILFV